MFRESSVSFSVAWPREGSQHGTTVLLSLAHTKNRSQEANGLPPKDTHAPPSIQQCPTGLAQTCKRTDAAQPNAPLKPGRGACDIRVTTLLSGIAAAAAAAAAGAATTAATCEAYELIARQFTSPGPKCHSRSGAVRRRDRGPDVPEIAPEQWCAAAAVALLPTLPLGVTRARVFPPLRRGVFAVKHMQVCWLLRSCTVSPQKCVKFRLVFCRAQRRS